MNHAELEVARRRVWPVLSVDGGGMRGLMAARVLEELEQRAGCTAAKLFRIGAGTSTGALLVAAALGLRRPLTGNEIACRYWSLGPAVFGETRRAKLWRACTSGHLCRSQALKDMVSELVGDCSFSEVQQRLIITATEVQARAGRVFDSQPKEPEDKALIEGVVLADVVTASAAAPWYFPPVRINNEYFVDGGLWANNPAEAAIDQIRDSATDSGPEVFVLSIGTGLPLSPTAPGGLISKQGRRWIKGTLSDVIGALPTERMLGRLNRRRVHVIRIQAELPPRGVSLAASSRRQLNALEAIARETIKTNTKALDMAVTCLGDLRGD